MGLNCGCVGEALASLSDVLCRSGFGQIQRLVFQRRFDGGQPNIIGDAEIVSADAWIRRIVAEDSTKVVLSPFIGNPELSSGAKRAFGGDNSTVNGVELNMGREAGSFSAVLYDESQSNISILKKMQCEVLNVFLVDEYGSIAAIRVNGGYTGIPVYSLFVGDKKFGGLTDPDSNQLTFSLKPNWSDNLVRLRAEELGYNLLYDFDREFTRDFNDDFNSDFAII